MKIYVAGPMRGIAQFNFPAFDRAAAMLTEAGHTVFNPADYDRGRYGAQVENSPTGDLADVAHLGFSLRETLRADFEWIMQAAEGIALLPGWENSSGATAEAALGRALGLVVEPIDHFLPTLHTPGVIVQFPETPFVPQTEAEFLGNAPTPPRLPHPTQRHANPQTGEVRTVSSTGGEKGTKPERFDLIPVEPLTMLARQYGWGAEKYEDRNWEKGFEFSKSYAALQRHVNAFWAGEDTDPESGLPHLAAAAWHAFALMEFGTTHPEMDDRPSTSG